MTENRVYNFSAGPSILPEEVLQRAKAEIMNYHGSGMSVMEMSHRSPVFSEIFSDTKAKLRSLLRVPETHEILFLQGGATLQFAAIPMNLMEGGTADYAVTGNFSKKAAKEAEKYGTVHIAYDTGDTGHDRIPMQEELKLSSAAKYFYYCANNTIYGTEWQYVPEVKAPLVCDMSSDILSRPVEVSRFGLIYAGAQKNMAPAGLTVVIIDKALAGRELPYTPQIMSYETMIQNDSLLNTPPCWCIYMLGAGRRGRHGTAQARAGKTPVRLSGREQALPLACAARIPQRHERHLPHGGCGAGCRIYPLCRGKGPRKPEGTQGRRRHAGLPV